MATDDLRASDDAMSTDDAPLDLRDSTWPSWIDSTLLLAIPVGFLVWALVEKILGVFILLWPSLLLLAAWRAWRLAGGLRRTATPPDRLHWQVWVSPTDYFGALTATGPSVLTVADGLLTLDGGYRETCPTTEVALCELAPRPLGRGIGLQLPSGQIRLSLVDPKDSAAMMSWVADRRARRALLAALAPSTVDRRDGRTADRA